MLVSGGGVKTGISFRTAPPLTAEVEGAIQRTVSYLLSLQFPEGYWVGELEADTTLESDSIKFWHFLGRVDRAREERLVRAILKQQSAEGGWPIYAGGPPELNATVKAYAALRLAGFSTEDPILEKARQVILELGGLERINSFEKVYLALFGCYPWDQVPALSPELILLPSWFPFNIYEISYWSRTILIPLAVVYATRPPAAPGDGRLNLDELWRDPGLKRAQITNLQSGGSFWRTFFLMVNRLLKGHESFPWKPFRFKALQTADRWISDRLIETDGLGAIFPAMLNAVFALKGLGYRDGDPLLEASIREMERLELAERECLKVQPCFSPVWDTALALYALGKIKTVSDTREPFQRAVSWLLSKEIRQWGDWVVKNPGGRPGGWSFQFRNPFYPDVDDTAQVLLAFKAVSGTCQELWREPDTDGAFQRGLDWILSMQNKDGGWSSFDKNNNCWPLNHFPFADHNAMLDPSCPDITGRILELLNEVEPHGQSPWGGILSEPTGGARGASRRVGLPRHHPSVRRAVAYLNGAQESDGTWFGRWGVGYLYGTWLALRGLKASGEPMGSLNYQRAGRWLLSRQNPDGGWGESCRSYDDPSVKGQGISTASQTAWALMALMSLGLVAEPGFQRGIKFLVETQNSDGNWPEEPFTGTGFPRVFYLRYHLYRTTFPLLALGEAWVFLKGKGA